MNTWVCIIAVLFVVVVLFVVKKTKQNQHHKNTSKHTQNKQTHTHQKSSHTNNTTTHNKHTKKTPPPKKNKQKQTNTCRNQVWIPAQKTHTKNRNNQKLTNKTQKHNFRDQVWISELVFVFVVCCRCSCFFSEANPVLRLFVCLSNVSNCSFCLFEKQRKQQTKTLKR